MAVPVEWLVDSFSELRHGKFNHTFTGMWIPRPLDTSQIVLTPEIERLSEQLARNAHEVWGRQRIRDGWVWGAERNDARREHPSLVPYEQLADGEREYDRQVAMETVKALIALGARVEAP